MFPFLVVFPPLKYLVDYTAHCQQRRCFGKGVRVGDRRLVISNVAAPDITATELVISYNQPFSAFSLPNLDISVLSFVNLANCTSLRYAVR